MNRNKKISAMAGLGLILVLACSCMAVKFKTPRLLYIPGDPHAIFRDDFPFQISPLTPEVSLALPPAREGNSVRLLPAGAENFEVKYYLMENAQQSIKVQTYILYSDPVSKKFLDIILKKQSEGVKIEFIADTYTKVIPKDRMLYSEYTKKGLEILGYEPIYFSGTSENGFLDPDEFNRRYHEKYLVVDDWYGITGGTNIAAAYALYQNKPNNMWRDQDVLVAGPVAADMSRAVDEDVGYFEKKMMEKPELINPRWWKTQREKHHPAPVPEGKPAQPRAEINLDKFDDENVTVRLICSQPRFEEDYIYQTYLYLFRAARKRIIMEIAYFVPDADMLEALLAARKRGVEVVLITNNAYTNDVFEMQPYTRSFYLPLIEAGAKVYEWQGIVKNKGSLHAKCAVFDDDITIVGSYNLDPRGKYLNSEDIVVMHSEKVAENLLDWFKKKDLPDCQEITLAQAQFWHQPTTLGGWLKLHFSELLKDYW